MICAQLLRVDGRGLDRVLVAVAGRRGGVVVGVDPRELTRSKIFASPEQIQPSPVLSEESEAATTCSRISLLVFAFSHFTTGSWSAGAVSRCAISVSQLPSSALCSAWVRWVSRMRRMPFERPAVASVFAQWIDRFSGADAGALLRRELVRLLDHQVDDAAHLADEHRREVDEELLPGRPARSRPCR
jgi:hypothetical protein